MMMVVNDSEVEADASKEKNIPQYKRMRDVGDGEIGSGYLGLGLFSELLI